MRRLLTINLLFLAFMARAIAGIVTDEGAWCWFADPRALHYESADGTINASYMGYIDVHGNICATQVDFVNGVTCKVLVRSYFQPDDHNNPTFLVLPDERIMIFYTRHTDEPCIYYRISVRPGDITSLGDEHIISTRQNTTYPSPFILSDDPTHIYLCWRGINWHPTIARLTMPDAADDVTIDFGPYQIVQSTGARPYAKYHSNGRDKIYLAYTTGHPDNEWPCWLYFNVIDINGGNGPILRDITGSELSHIGQTTFRVSKTDDYRATYPMTLIDAPTDARDWLWQISTDEAEHPVVAMTRISEDKNSHTYLHAQWTGRKWQLTELADGGHAFHQNWQRTEKCYSGGMAIDPANTNTLYLSVPVGDVYEIQRVVLNKKGKITRREFVTSGSAKNNMRPYVLSGSAHSPLRLCWMYGDYYYWMVNRQYPQGYPTAIRSDYTLPPSATADNILFDAADYHGQTVQVGRDIILGVNADNHLYLRRGGKTHTSPCRYLTSDDWARFSSGTSGDWWPTRIDTAHITLCEADGYIILLRNGAIEMKLPK